MSNTQQLNQIRQTILKKKFGNLLTWEKPQIEKTVGPFNQSIFDDFETQRLMLVNEAELALSELSDDDIFLLFENDLNDPDSKRKAWADFLKGHIQELQRRTPSWIEGGFGHPDYRADFDYWGKMEEYTLHEALMLSVGIEPKHFSEERLSGAKKTSKKGPLIAPVDYLVKRHEQFDRKWPFGSFGPPRVSPTFLFNWFTEVSLDVDRTFLGALRQRFQVNNELDEEQNETANRRADRREIDTIAQLFTAMAIDNLGYNPHDLRGPIPKEIADLAADMGLSVSDETVRKYLRLGAKFIPKDWEPK